MTSANRLECLTRAPRFDLVVVGGGATGLGVALDAALRGFSVALFESHDFAGGTSSRSTKLLHGGVRYLAQGNVSLVREALVERSTVMQIAPHLAQPLPFVMPSYGWWQTPFYGIGLKLYDLMAGSAGLGHTEILDRTETERALPGIRSEALHGGVRYWDGQFDDARLALSLARTAEREGALVFNHTEVSSLYPDEQGFRLEVTDHATGDLHEVTARCVVNATGVWVDELRARVRDSSVSGPGHRLVTPSQGVHVVVDRHFMPGTSALLVPKTRDGRVLFAVPWMGKLVLGTTDTPREDLPREPKALDEELDFILTEAGRVLAQPVRRDDIRSIWVGLRPLVSPPSSGSGGTQVISREHTVLVDRTGLVTVTGGKWTTYRAMAEDVLDRCFAAGLLPASPGGKTERCRLVGAPPEGAQSVAIHESPGLHLYGSCAAEVLSCPGGEVSLGMGLNEAMVRYAVRSEFALTVEDVLARRWRSLFLDARQAAGMAARVGSVMAEEGVIAPGVEGFLSLCDHYLPDLS